MFLALALLVVGCGSGSARDIAAGGEGSSGTAGSVGYCDAAAAFFALDESDAEARVVAFELMVAVAPAEIRDDAEALLPMTNDLAEGRPIADADLARELVARIAEFTNATCPEATSAAPVPAGGCRLDEVPAIGVERFEFDMAGAVAECVAVLEAGQEACDELSGAAELAECFEGLEGEATAMLDQAMVLAGELPAVYEFANPDDPRVDAGAWAERLEAARASFEGYVSSMCDLTVERSLSLSWSGRESQVGSCEIDLIQSQLTYLAEFSLLD